MAVTSSAFWKFIPFLIFSLNQFFIFLKAYDDNWLNQFAKSIHEVVIPDNPGQRISDLLPIATCYVFDVDAVTLKAL